MRIVALAAGLFAAMFGLAAGRLPAAVYHVSPVGDDSATGDGGHPLRTISQAGNLAGPGDVVLIGPGVYREYVGLARSGTVDRPITFQAEKTGTAVVSGAEPVAMWVAVSGHPGQFISDWPFDFAGDKAEQVFWESHPLREVAKPSDLGPGSFWVDRQFHTVTVWLPGGIDARGARIEGSGREYLISPTEKNDHFSDVRNITLTGLVFRDAANLGPRGGVVLGTGWHADHCTVEENSGGGMILDGDNILVDHCIAQYNGFGGISGWGENIAIQDCIVRGNNRKGIGGGFAKTKHLRVIRHTSYENVGPGIWLDGDNSDYSITDSTIYGNRGLNEDWEGSGICLENSPGPGVVFNNIIYSNTGAGILMARSEQLSIEFDVLADNGQGIELRAKVGNIDITRNRFKEWRKEAIATSQGDWPPASVSERGIGIDRNIYDPLKGTAFVLWGNAVLPGMAEIRSVLGLEVQGSVGLISFAHSLENVRTMADPDRPTIAKALADATEGGTLAIPVNWRSPVLDDDSCAVFDGDNNCVMVALPTEELRRRMRDAVSVTPTGVAVPVEVRIDQINPHGDVRGTLVEIK